MGYYPAMLDLAGRPCLVIGGGEVGLRKVEGLLEAGALVTVIEPRPGDDLTALARKGRVELVFGPFEPSHLDGIWLAIAATDDEAQNRAVSDAAWERGIFVNVVDVPELCTFIVPASVRRGDLLLSVSTSGASPAVAARIRRRLETEYGPAWEVYLDLMGRVREKVLAGGLTPAERRNVFEELASSDMVAMIEAGDEGGIEEMLRKICGPGFGLQQLGISLGGGK